MADDRYESSVRSIGEKAEETAEGVVRQVSDRMRSAYGKTVETAMDGAENVKDAAVAGHDFLKRFIEENPHTTTVIALGLGLLIGYAAHRPPPKRGWWD